MVPSILTYKGLILLATLNLLAFSKAGLSGYTYNKPLGTAASDNFFTSLSTVRPLPPLPALPSLPTGRPQSKVITQSLLQVHPSPSNTYTGSSFSSFQSTSKPKTSGFNYKGINQLSSSAQPSYYSGSSSFGSSSYGSSSFGGQSSFSTSSPNKSYDRYGSKYKGFSSFSTIPTAPSSYSSKYKSFSSFSTIPTAPSSYGQRLSTPNSSRPTFKSYSSGSYKFPSSSSSLTSTAPQTFGHNGAQNTLSNSKPSAGSAPTFASVQPPSAQSYGNIAQPLLLGSTVPTKQTFGSSPQTITLSQQPLILNASGPELTHYGQTFVPITQGVAAPQTLIPIEQANSGLTGTAPQTFGPSPVPPAYVPPHLLQSLRTTTPPLATPPPTLPTPTPSFVPYMPVLAEAPPLRIPFGKTAIINLPPNNGNNGNDNDDIYELNGRQLKQYAVVEIIDNDIEPSPGPRVIFNTPFFDDFRARLGASGTGASHGPISISNALQQQRTSFRLNNPGDAVALGSGGLGFIRSSNGNVYLGSGSLGYISSQQHSQSLTDARTRTGAAQPDALHFGHGPLGGNPITIRIK